MFMTVLEGHGMLLAFGVGKFFIVKDCSAYLFPPTISQQCSPVLGTAERCSQTFPYVLLCCFSPASPFLLGLPIQLKFFSSSKKNQIFPWPHFPFQLLYYFILSFRTKSLRNLSLTNKIFIHFFMSLFMCLCTFWGSGGRMLWGI